ncbi:restriction endonuclease subunit S [Egibacter rhizosphaerae]|uniref:restriction endonuclease subunit S n=1 Tax=Egibacter rhizosphaerae TaxID=1670831 RepID=UPI00197AB234|nr:restriction endonuclease subunit S [Egibacter rhizosphaerae]
MVRSTDINLDGSWNIDDVARRSLHPGEKIAKRLSRGDLVVVKSSGSADHLGKTAIVGSDVEALEACFSNFVQRLRPCGQADPRYVWYLLNSKKAASELQLLGTTATGLRNLNGGIIGSVTFPGPRLAEQRAIADFLDAETARIDALIASKERLASALAARSQAITDRSMVPRQLGGVADDGRDEWPVIKLKHIATYYTDGDWIETPYITDDGIRLIQTGNIGPGRFKDQGFRFISEPTFQELRCTEVFPGDVLISRLAGTLGQACVAPDLGTRMITAVDVVILRPTSWVDPEFLVMYLSTSRHLGVAELNARGTTMLRLSRSQVGDMHAPLPPVDIQRQAVWRVHRSLDAVNRVLDKLSSQLGLLRERRQALITSAVSGELEGSGVAA